MSDKQINPPTPAHQIRVKGELGSAWADGVRKRICAFGVPLLAVMQMESKQA